MLVEYILMHSNKRNNNKMLCLNYKIKQIQHDICIHVLPSIIWTNKNNSSTLKSV